MDIGQDILNTTPLGPLQTSLLEHISKLISFGESFDPSKDTDFYAPTEEITW